MAETIGAVVVLLLAVYGCAEVIRWAVMRLLWPTRGKPGVWVIPLCGHCEDVEYQVRRAAADYRWNGLPGRGVYLLNVGADEETCALARRVCQAVKGVQLVDGEELRAIFSKNSLQEGERLV